MPMLRQLLLFSFALLLCLEPLPSTGHPRIPELTMTSFSVRSTIVSRYASTRVRTELSNPHAEPKEAIFDLDLPGSAFISNFTITINKKLYVAEVKEKRQAKKMYDEARKQGQTAAHVGTRDRETEKFRVSASVAAGSQVSFELSYEELLQRHLGKYQHAVSVRPQQVVGNLTVEVSISERTGIDYVHVLPLRTSRLLTNTLRGDADVPPSTWVEKGSHCAWVVFTPTPQEQAAFSSSGILGDFVVQYDVTMPDVAGDVQIYNGYFVHYFAPRGLPPVQKNVVFVIDISGSMHGTKMKQTKKAMHIILSDLHPDDCFNIVTFSDTVHVWKAERSIPATAHNVRSAKDYVHRMEADGWTDINKALLEAASVLTQGTPEPSPPRIPLLIFLTDGEPTAGVTSGTRILANTQQALGGSVSLFGLAFGDDADYGLLRRLALENRGVARRIYEDADATLQLAGFYDEIASPLLYDVALSYRDGADLTRTLFPHYFQGAELVVAGRLAPGATELHVEAAGHGHTGQLRLENDISANATEAAPFGCSPDLGQIGRFVQRLWAYFTIQELLQARFHSNDTAARWLLTEKATNLSLKYNFVTPVTSLVVVKPEEEERTTARATPGAPRTPLVTTAAHRGTKASGVMPTPGATSTSLSDDATKVATVLPNLARATPVPGTSATSQGTSKRARATPAPDTATATPPPPTAHSVTKAARATPGKAPKAGNPRATTHPPPSPGSATAPPSGQQEMALQRATKRQPHPRTERAPFSWGTAAPTAWTVTDAWTGNSTAATSPGPNATTPRAESQGPQGTPAIDLSQWLLLLPAESELLSAKDVAEKFVESLHPPAVYSFVAAKGEKGVLDYEDYSDLLEEQDGDTAGMADLAGAKFFTFSSSVDGDPHFVARLPGSSETLCFTLDGHPGDVLQLVTDPPSGLSVHAHLVGAPPWPGSADRPRTYLDTITVRVGPPRLRYVITVTLQGVALQGEGALDLPFDRPAWVSRPGLGMRVGPGTNVTLQLGAGLEFVVQRHRYSHPSPLQRDHLGFYMLDGSGLSAQARGLLGQFQNADIRLQPGAGERPARLQRGGATVPATRVTKLLKDSPLPAHHVPCWLVKGSNVEALLGGAYGAFVVPHPLEA
ncbi:inter-alpha-trypsin inhibitor heavy chain H6 [Gopherus evgoodei]|uniref:inter-alpha-trypsin inhibitor heavy chain H6 n=1 Tax=Gopherus evgoodei TaxID=1825980 RepID=UPI0011CF46D9|nr:inter-alpha-trypsin inhibitor heavy chain H6 [Gopherus evgoodei]XP_030403129.1 inter-alpha-trypsin inhibitor heavy chain H6 [Gopherus evgoodei]XP_030403130.1 inter-alpha-trypsin inhibitor heavy chain H6 [Gopherus evgoodei]